MDSQTSAIVSLVGMLFDVVGGLYLAYDLLGGEKGPLSTFTRAFTYSLILTLVYALFMGLKFGLLAGISLGTALGLQLERLGRQEKITPRFTLVISILRGTGLGCAIHTLGHPYLAAIAAVITFTASSILPIFNISPALLLESGKRPSINLTKLLLALFFGACVAIVETACVVSGLVSGEAVPVMIRLVLTIITATLLVSTISPSIEWYADNVEPRVLGYFGTILFLLGFVIQAIPSLILVLK